MGGQRVTHRWAPIVPRFWRHQLGYGRADLRRWRDYWGGHPRKSICVKCGAETWAVRDFRYRDFRYSKFFRPWAGIAGPINRMPVCEGLPTNYDAPMGA